MSRRPRKGGARIPEAVGGHSCSGGKVTGTLNCGKRLLERETPQLLYFRSKNEVQSLQSLDQVSVTSNLIIFGNSSKPTSAGKDCARWVASL